MIKCKKSNTKQLCNLLIYFYDLFMWKMNNRHKICALIHKSVFKNGILAVASLSEVHLDISNTSRGYLASKGLVLCRSANPLESIYRNTCGKQTLFIVFNICEGFLLHYFSADIS